MLRLVHVQPQNRDGIFLNEDLVLTFSEELDPSSVTHDSVRILDAGGGEARGEWIASRSSLRFQPAPVLDAGLQLGGYRPGEKYTVQLRGFPTLSGLRAKSGAPLDASLEWGFETIDPSRSAGGVVFDDASPGTGHGLVPTTRLAQRLELGPWREPLPMEPEDPILLLCAEPLDPSTLFAEDFLLHPAPGIPSLPLDGSAGREPEDETALEPPPSISLRARLVRNFDEGERPEGEPACAVIELQPTIRLSPGEYRLGFVPSLRLRDFGGNQVWRVGTTRVLPRLFVERRAKEPTDSLLIDFLDGTQFIPIAVPGTDGTPVWGAGGIVGPRYPAAAGSGDGGPVVLGGGQELTLDDRGLDLHATRIDLPPEVVHELPASSGRVFLRSQGSIRIAGSLRRRLSEAVAGERERSQDLYLRSFPGMDLSHWLNSESPFVEDWTVLIAGGDLIVEGDIEVDTPLLLVAGGRLRVSGRVRAPEGALWYLGSGGSLNLDPTLSSPNLVLDAPMQNPLQVPLRYAAVSSQVPKRGGSLRWRNPVVNGHAGEGSYRVRYLPADAPIDPSQAVDHPGLLPNGGPVRLLVEFELWPRRGRPRAWDPPYIDSVQLAWERPGAGEPR